MSGALALVVAPLALAAVTLEVAPHVYEVPQHLCPFCLFKADAYFIGYPLFGAIFFWLRCGVSCAAPAGAFVFLQRARPRSLSRFRTVANDKAGPGLEPPRLGSGLCPS